MEIVAHFIYIFFSGQLASSLGVSFNYMQTSLFFWLRNAGVSFNHVQPSLFLWLRNGGWSTMTLLFGHVYLRVHGEFDILDRCCPFFPHFPQAHYCARAFIPNNMHWSIVYSIPFTHIHTSLHNQVTYGSFTYLFLSLYQTTETKQWHMLIIMCMDMLYT